MAEIEIKSKDGKSVGKHTFGEKISKLRQASHTSLHRTVLAEEANGRQGTQSAQTRSEVAGGGRKPYRQKKTGNARQGSTRAPHYAHGSMALAVKPRDYSKKVNKKERRASILTALFDRVNGGDVTVVDAITFTEPKTKVALDNLANVTVKTAPVRSSAKGDEAPKTDVFSTRDLLVARKIVIAKDALVKVEEAWA